MKGKEFMELVFQNEWLAPFNNIWIFNNAMQYYC